MSIDALLNSTSSALLEHLDEQCSNPQKKIFDIFSGINDDLWAMLLLKEYTLYPNIRKVLPDLPDPELQIQWVGGNGVSLTSRTLDFYSKVKTYFLQYGNKPLSEARILDFGCGWGRIIRYFAKDVLEDQLFGCDPDITIIEQCKKDRVPGTIAISKPRPQTLPFDGNFDLIYAFSVFTHLSEKTHLECLNVIRQYLAPGGVLILTVLTKSVLYRRGLSFYRLTFEEIEECANRYDRGEYIFLGHQSTIIEGEDTYGDTCVPLKYIEQHWKPLFHVIDSSISVRDQEQFVLVCK